MDTIFQIGKGGIGEELCAQLSNALEARELIKIRVLESSGYRAREAAEEIAAAIGAEIAGTIGTKIILYRPSEKKRRIDVTIRAHPTTYMEPKRDSTWSLKNIPTTNIGIMDTTIFRR